MNKDKIIDRITKVKALADRGTDGERAAAERLLKELMDKYGITDEDIASEKVDFYVIHTGKEDMYRCLFSQIFHQRFGAKKKLYNLMKVTKKDKKILSDAGFGDKDADLGFDCTKSEFVELKALFEIYKADFDKNLEIFQYAYFRKNDLLCPREEDSPEATDEELEIARQAEKMSYGIRKKEVHKMIESGSHETNP